MPKQSKGGPRDSVFTVRLPEKLRFALDLTAKLYRESMTDVAVRALTDAISSENGGLFVQLLGEQAPVFLLPKVWDERESVRCVKLALVYPSLLTAPERRAWEAIRVKSSYWLKGKSDRTRAIGDLNIDALEQDWEEILAQAN